LFFFFLGFVFTNNETRPLLEFLQHVCA